MAYALSDYRSLIANLLKDSTNAVWTTYELDDALRMALMEYSNAYPRRLRMTVTLTASARTYDLTAAPFFLTTGVLWLEHVAYPYDNDLETGPLLPFELRDNTLVVLTTSLPEVGEAMLIEYCLAHTINGLESAPSTTVPDNHAHVLAQGAAAHAAHAKAVQMAREFNWPASASRDMKDWGTTMLRDFRDQLQRVNPSSAWASWGSPAVPGFPDP